MRAKEIIGGIGLILILIGASCDLEYSDIRAVFAITLIGTAISYFCLKDYDYEHEDD